MNMMEKELEALRKESITLDFRVAKGSAIDSKIGGMLYIEDKKNYPRDSKGNLMIFLCQINLEDLPLVGDLPKTGLLQFFIPNDKYFTYDEHEPCKVLYIETFSKSKSLKKNIFLKEFFDMTPYETECTLCFAKEHMDAPNPSSNIFNEIGEKYYKNCDYPYSIFEKYYFRPSQIFGYPFYNQEETITNDELLLLQLDTNKSNHIMFGDDGTCHFYIKKDDLLKGDFSKVRYDIDFC